MTKDKTPSEMMAEFIIEEKLSGKYIKWLNRRLKDRG